MRTGVPTLICGDHWPFSSSPEPRIEATASSSISCTEIDGFAAELIDRFGKLPQEVEFLLKIVEIKGLCRTANVEKIEAGPKGVVLTLRENTFPNPGALVELINDERGNAKLRPDHKLVFKRDWETPEERLTGTHRLMSTLAKLADQAKAA